MLLDTDNDGKLVNRANGQDGTAIITTKEGRMIRYEERDGRIHVEQLGQEPTPACAPRNN